MEEIIELKKQIEETNKHIEELKKQVEELKNKENKEHKSLSDYRIYGKLENGEWYKRIDNLGEVSNTIYSHKSNFDKKQLMYGNAYLDETPNELLERECRKRQLWFELEKHLKENNCLATNEDWKKEEKAKYCAYWVNNIEEWSIAYHYNSKHTVIYSNDRDILKEYMNTLSEEEIKIMFDVD